MNNARTELGKVFECLFFRGCRVSLPLRFLHSTLKMSDLSQVAVYSESSDIYKVSED